MVSGPLGAPPSLGKSEPDRLAGGVSKGSALWFWKARKARREARVGLVRMVGAQGGPPRFLLGLWEGMAGRRLPTPWLGFSISPYLLGARPETLRSFPAHSHPPFLPQLLAGAGAGARARALHALTSSLPETRRREGARHESAGATVTFPPGSGGSPPLQSARARGGAAGLLL